MRMMDDGLNERSMGIRSRLDDDLVLFLNLPGTQPVSAPLAAERVSSCHLRLMFVAFLDPTVWNAIRSTLHLQQRDWQATVPRIVFLTSGSALWAVCYVPHTSFFSSPIYPGTILIVGVEFVLKLIVGIPRTRGLLYSP